MNIRTILSTEVIKPHNSISFSDFFIPFCKKYQLLSNANAKNICLIMVSELRDINLKIAELCDHLTVSQLREIKSMAISLNSQYLPSNSSNKKYTESLICYDIDFPNFIFFSTNIKNHNQSGIKCGFFIELDNLNSIELINFISKIYD